MSGKAKKSYSIFWIWIWNDILNLIIISGLILVESILTVFGNRYGNQLESVSGA